MNRDLEITLEWTPSRNIKDTTFAKSTPPTSKAPLIVSGFLPEKASASFRATAESRILWLCHLMHHAFCLFTKPPQSRLLLFSFAPACEGHIMCSLTCFGTIGPRDCEVPFSNSQLWGMARAACQTQRTPGSAQLWRDSADIPT